MTEIEFKSKSGAGQAPATPLLLPLGPCYLSDPEHYYLVLVYDLERSVNVTTGLLPPEREEIFSRFYPNHIGMLGNPSDVFFIVHRFSETLFKFIFGYIGWNGYPILVRTLLHPSTSWNAQEMIGLDQNQVDWLKGAIDRKTCIVKWLLFYKQLDRMTAERARREALARSANILKEFAKRKKRKHLTKTEREKRERVRRKERERKLQWRLEQKRQHDRSAVDLRLTATLGNLQSIAKYFAIAAYQSAVQTAVKDGFKGDLERDLGLPAEPQAAG